MESEMKIRAKAKVRVMLEIPVSGGGWGSDCTIDQVHKQAKEDVLEQLNRVIAGEYDSSNPVLNGKWTIVSARVVGILTEDKD